MTETTRRPYVSRLAIRFAIILALALLPAGVIAFVQTNALEKEIRARGEIALMGATVQSALAETGMIRRVRGMVGSLASAIPYVVDNPDACKALMHSVASVEPTLAVVGFIPLSGVMSCSNADGVYDFSDSPIFLQAIKEKQPLFSVNPRGPISKTSILGISHPVLDTSGTYIGYVGVSLPHENLDELRLEAFDGERGLAASVLFWTFDQEGTILTSNTDLNAAAKLVPAERELRQFVNSEALVFRAASKDGRQMTYAVVPIMPGELYLMSATSVRAAMLPGAAILEPYLPTLLMWLVGLLAAGLAAELLVTRHVRTLNRSIVAFARGDRRLQAIDLKNAPAELDELASAYLAMTENITRSEAELEDTLHQKEVLLREVHHRVKNNLQLISSIMNIQIRSARSDEAREFLKNLQERIMSLATVHRGLYQTSGLADVRARELIPDIVRQIMSMSSGDEKPFHAQNDIDDLRLVPDQAVPLSLLLTEALTNAMKHAEATRDHPGRLTVRLKRSGGSGAVLEVINSKRETKAPPIGMPDTGLGSQLIAAFVQQLGGRQESGEVDGDYYLRVHFEVSPLSLAENQQKPEMPGST